MDLIVQNSITNYQLVVNEGEQLEIVLVATPELVLEVNGEIPIGNNSQGFISAGSVQFPLGTAVFSNGNGVTFGANGSVITASVNTNGGGGTISAGASSISLGAVVFANSNSVSFGLNGSTITASFDQVTQSQSAYLFSNSNNVSFGTNGSTITASASFSQSAYIFSNSNNVSFGSNGSTVTATATFPSQTNYVFSNSNNVSFGTNGSTVTATVTVPAQTQFVLSNSNGLSWGTNGSTVTGAYSVPSVTNSSWTVSADTRSETVSQLVFANSNGVSFGLTGGTITGTVQTNYLTTGMASDAGSRFVNTSAGLNLTNISATFNSNSISLSVGNYITTAAQSNQVVNSINGSTGIFSFNTGSSLSSSRNGNSITWGLASDITTALQSAGAYLTTAMASDAGSRFVNTSAGLNLTNVSATFNSNSISLSVAAQGLTSQSNQALSAANGSFTFQTATFANSNGVSFSTGSQGIFATVQTNYITTAMDSDAGSRFVNTSAGVNLTNISATFNSNSISLSVGNYITTADLSQNSSKYIQEWALTGNTAGTTSSAQGTRLYLSGGTNITLSGSSNSIVFSVGNYITTARGSTDAVGLNTAQTNVTWTVNSSGISLNAGGYAGTNTAITGGSVTLNTSGISINLPAYLTTADLSQNSSKYVQNWKLTGNTSGTTSSAQGTDLWFQGGNSITVSGSSNSIVFSVGNYITTADLSQNSSKYVQNWKLTGNTAGTTSSAQGTDFWIQGGNNITVSGSSNTIVISAGVGGASNMSITADNASSLGSLSQLYFKNSNGISFGLSTSNNGSATLTATVQTNYLTTAALSGDTSKYIQNWKLTGNTAGTTSSAQGTDLWFSGGANVTISGSSNSIIISAAATASANINISAGTASNNLSAFVLSNSNNATFGLNGSTVTVSSPISISAGASNGNFTNVVFSNSNGISFGLNGSTITAQEAFNSYFMFPTPPLGNNNLQINSNSTSYIHPFQLPFNLSASYIRFQVTNAMNSTSFASSINTTFSASILSTFLVYFYSLGVGANSRSLQSVASGSVGMTQQISLAANSTGSQYSISHNITYPFEGNSTNSTQISTALTNASFQISTNILSDFNGVRFLDIPFANSLSMGAYWIALGGSSSAASQGAAALSKINFIMSNQVATQINQAIGFLNVPTNNSIGAEVGIGSFATNSSVADSIALANISSRASQPVFIFQLIRQA